jgi:hypothetical protein
MKLVVVEAHKSNYPNPIGFKKGERLRTEKRDTEFEGWIWVITHDGNEGWAPVRYLEVKEGTDKAVASRDYTARELDTSVGEELTLHYELNEWGWVEKTDGSCGWVPMKTTRVL